MPDLNPVSTSSQTPVTSTPPAIQQAITAVRTSQEQREPSATDQPSTAVLTRKTDVVTKTTATLDIDIPTMASALFKTIRERLSLMGAIAECKLILGKAIFDQDREKIVLDSASKIAKECGINEESYKSFIQAQMIAAKVVQKKHLELFDKNKADTATPEERNEAENKLEQLRQQLNRHSELMGKQISRYLGEHEAFKEEMRNPFISSLSVDHLPEEYKTEIFTQLLAIRLEEPMVEAGRLAP